MRLRSDGWRRARHTCHRPRARTNWRGPDIGAGFHRGRLVRQAFYAKAKVGPGIEQMDDDVEALFARRPVHRRQVDEADETASRRKVNDASHCAWSTTTVNSSKATVALATALPSPAVILSTAPSTRRARQRRGPQAQNSARRPLSHLKSAFDRSRAADFPLQQHDAVQQRLRRGRASRT